MTITFAKATKAQLKARIALDGPTGAGKTWTALESATVLGEKIVMIDTERGSGALYSDHFDFDYFRFEPPYDPAKLVEVLRAAEEQGYEVVIIDSLSHFWEGEGGTLDIVDAAAQRAQGNSFAGWKVGTPALRHLVDTILGIDAHVIVTMRSKMEYILETNDRGKQVPRKVGMAPVMRQGIEFEFTLVGDMDLDHRMVISKSRCSALADQVIQPNRAKEMAESFKAWLASGEPMVNREQVAKIKGVLDGITDTEERKRTKGLFLDAYGRPDQLIASRFDDALRFAQEQAGTPATAGTPEFGEPAPPRDDLVALRARATELELSDADLLVYAGTATGKQFVSLDELTPDDVELVADQLAKYQTPAEEEAYAAKKAAAAKAPARGRSRAVANEPEDPIGPAPGEPVGAAAQQGFGTTEDPF